MANNDSPVRIGEAERTASRQALDTHLNAGRLGIEEYAERSSRASAATTAQELAQLFTDLPAPHPRLPGLRTTAESGWRRPPVIFGAVLVLVIGVVVAVALTTAGRSPSPTAAGPTTALSTDQPTATPIATTLDSSAPSTSASDSSASTTAAPPTSPGAGEPKYLAELDAVDHSSNGQLLSRAATVNGQFFGRSLIFYNSCYNNAGGVVWAEYNLSRAYHTFSTTVGISDDDPGTTKGTYRVLVDGTEAAKGDIATGVSKPIQLTVTNALHIRLEVTNPATALSSCSGTEVHNTWGDAQIA